VAFSLCRNHPIDRPSRAKIRSLDGRIGRLYQGKELTTWGKMNSNKSRGSAFERAVLKHLQARGYYAIRSAGSHQIVDILAVRGFRPTWPHETTILFIQCKRSGDIPPKEWNDLFSTATRYRAKPLMAETGDRGKGPKFWEILTPKLPSTVHKGRYTGDADLYVP